jgi:predicted nucleic acid-binding protein
LEQELQIALQALQKFRIFPISGIEIAIKRAENYRYLRGQGITIRKTIDCLIATFVMERQFSLLHSDRDFDPFEQFLSLQVFHSI